MQCYGEPDPDVFQRFDRSNFLKRIWKPIVSEARLVGIRPKELRDSHASYLLTCGVQLGYVSRQLGH